MGTRSGAGQPGQAAVTASVREAKSFRPCQAQVTCTDNSRSTKRLPAALWVPKQRRCQSTAGQRARFATLLVSVSPSTQLKVHRTCRCRCRSCVSFCSVSRRCTVSQRCVRPAAMSHGRSIVGLGAAWHQPEFIAYDWPFPQCSTEWRCFGRRYRSLTGCSRNVPQPATASITPSRLPTMTRCLCSPRPPIMIGGSSERVTLTLVAQYADYCNVFGDPATVAHTFDVLRQPCETVGQQFNEITPCSHGGMLIARNEAELAIKQERHPTLMGSRYAG